MGGIRRVRAAAEGQDMVHLRRRFRFVLLQHVLSQ